MYKINITVPKNPYILQDFLTEGFYSANSHYFTKDGQPWIPIMGEFHYSRYPKEEWGQELWKMKSGGIEIIASYVIWIHHEEEKGNWLSHENYDLRYFIELCHKLELKFFYVLVLLCMVK